MRKISYRIELDSDEGYLISNADVDWEAMPQDENIKNPSIRIIDILPEPGYSKWWSDISECIEIDTDNKGLDPEFRDKYREITCGKLPHWKLIGARIHRTFAELCFCNICTSNYDIGYVSYKDVSNAKAIFEAVNRSGQNDQYLLEITRESAGHYVCITETVDNDKREIVLDRGFEDNKSDNDEFEYAYVTDYR